MATIDLSTLPRTLWGWRPFTWRLSKRIEGAGVMAADLGPFPISIPGSVQRALLEAGVIADWNIGLQSLDCEWVEHRHWDLTTPIPAGLIPSGERVVLHADALDYSGWILVDCVEVGRFEGALIPHSFDLTAALSDGKPHVLSIIFDQPPHEQGQIGYTSLSRFFKPRYNYSWDWTPRVVPIGVAGRLTLRTGASATFEISRLQATLAEDQQTGSVEITLETTGASTVSLSVLDGERELAQTECPAAAGITKLSLGQLNIEPWQPNGAGCQKLYDVLVEATDAAGASIWSERRRVGFRRIEWLPCEGAPEDAEPWICSVNGKPIFLQGANWVPPKASYPDATESDYRALIRLYREMGCNVLRVWGGAILETELFYSLCDEAGILVWQEFPLSSSGVENCPPDAPDAIERLTAIAASYIRRRAHHASLLLWCGGNELTRGENGEKAGIIPIDYAHPCIAALRDLVNKEDPGRRFIPTSPSGPSFCADANNYGKGLHHDTHGPWGMGGFADIEAWRTYWAGDDSLFRSEVGMPGACDADAIRRYAGEDFSWPPTGPYWMHTAAWWLQWDRYEKDLDGLDTEEALAEYVERTQSHQAEAYAIAAQSSKQRFPKCGGFIIWMGHDLFPCPINNSIIDIDANPKPAYYALQRVFANP